MISATHRDSLSLSLCPPTSAQFQKLRSRVVPSQKHWIHLRNGTETRCDNSRCGWVGLQKSLVASGFLSSHCYLLLLLSSSHWLVFDHWPIYFLAFMGESWLFLSGSNNKLRLQMSLSSCSVDPLLIVVLFALLLIFWVPTALALCLFSKLHAVLTPRRSPASLL